MPRTRNWTSPSSGILQTQAPASLRPASILRSVSFTKAPLWQVPESSDARAVAKGGVADRLERGVHHHVGVLARDRGRAGSQLDRRKIEHVRLVVAVRAPDPEVERGQRVVHDLVEDGLVPEVEVQ